MTEQSNVEPIDGTKNGAMAKAHAEPAAEEGKTPEIFKAEDPKFMKKIVDGANKINEIKDKRKALSADIAAVMANFESDGLNKKAVKAAMTYVDLDDKERDNYDLSYTITRKALGVPVQGDLFEAAVASEMRDRASH